MSRCGRVGGPPRKAVPIGAESGIAAAGCVTAEESSDFVAIAADGHGAPAAAMRAGIIVEEETAGGVGTAADGSARAFDDEVGGGASESGQEPVKAAFAGDELERPDSLLEDELIVAFGDAEDFVDGLNPGGGEGLSVDNGSKDGAETFAKAEDAEEDDIHSVRCRSEKGTEMCGTILGDQTSIDQERDEFIPGEIVGGGGEVSEIEGETTGDEVRGERAGHITGLLLQYGYIRNGGSGKRKVRNIGGALGVLSSGGVFQALLNRLLKSVKMLPSGALRCSW